MLLHSHVFNKPAYEKGLLECLLCVYLSGHPFVSHLCLAICLPSLCLAISLPSFCLPVCLSHTSLSPICLSTIPLPVHLSVLSICLSPISLSPSLCLVHLSVSHPSVSLCISLYAHELLTNNSIILRILFIFLIIGFCILLRVILTVNNNTCFATIDKVFY
jgi:hypothetical protein